MKIEIKSIHCFSDSKGAGFCSCAVVVVRLFSRQSRVSALCLSDSKSMHSGGISVLEVAHGILGVGLLTLLQE